MAKGDDIEARLVNKELNESRVRLKIIWKGQLLLSDQIKDTDAECDELCRIINASVQTAKRRVQNV